MTASLFFVSFGSLQSQAIEFHTFQDLFSTHASWQLVAEQGLALTGRGENICEFLRKHFSQRDSCWNVQLCVKVQCFQIDIDIPIAIIWLTWML